MVAKTFQPTGWRTRYRHPQAQRGSTGTLACVFLCVLPCTAKSGWVTDSQAWLATGSDFWHRQECLCYPTQPKVAVLPGCVTGPDSGHSKEWLGYLGFDSAQARVPVLPAQPKVAVLLAASRAVLLASLANILTTSG
jgi:hypothetical protein